MLMAATVSGAGPESHDSTVSLTTLVPPSEDSRDVLSEAAGVRSGGMASGCGGRGSRSSRSAPGER